MPKSEVIGQPTCCAAVAPLSKHVTLIRLPLRPFSVKPRSPSNRQIHTLAFRYRIIDDENDKLKLIMTLEASNERTARAFAYFDENGERYKAPNNPHFVEYNSRQTTPLTAFDDGDDRNDKSRLILTFRISPKDIERGFVFSSNLNVCDILLGSKRDGISSRYFSITFDGQRRLIVRDFLRKGTIVSYNGYLAEEGRQNFT